MLRNYRGATQLVATRAVLSSTLLVSSQYAYVTADSLWKPQNVNSYTGGTCSASGLWLCNGTKAVTSRMYHTARLHSLEASNSHDDSTAGPTSTFASNTDIFLYKKWQSY
jgi:hypothetical protein